MILKCILPSDTLRDEPEREGLGLGQGAEPELGKAVGWLIEFQGLLVIFPLKMSWRPPQTGNRNLVDNST